MTAEERRIFCPFCEKEIPMLAGAAEGDMIDCPNCAGIKLRLGTKDGKETLHMMQMVSCPTCGERIPIDDDTAAGTIVRHDGADHVLTKEFGAFALEAV